MGQSCPGRTTFEASLFCQISCGILLSRTCLTFFFLSVQCSGLQTRSVGLVGKRGSPLLNVSEVNKERLDPAPPHSCGSADCMPVTHFGCRAWQTHIQAHFSVHFYCENIRVSCFYMVIGERAVFTRSLSDRTRYATDVSFAIFAPIYFWPQNSDLRAN